jgi:hypothetical protein
MFNAMAVRIAHRNGLDRPMNTEDRARREGFQVFMPDLAKFSSPAKRVTVQRTYS